MTIVSLWCNSWWCLGPCHTSLVLVQAQPNFQLFHLTQMFPREVWYCLFHPVLGHAWDWLVAGSWWNCAQESDFVGRTRLVWGDLTHGTALPQVFLSFCRTIKSLLRFLLEKKTHQQQKFPLPYFDKMYVVWTISFSGVLSWSSQWESTPTERSKEAGIVKYLLFGTASLPALYNLWCHMEWGW